MIFTSTTAIPDPRESALTRARQLYPGATLVEQIAVAEFLLRPVPRPAVTSEPPAWWQAPFTSRVASGGYVVTNGAALDALGADLHWTPAPAATAVWLRVVRDNPDDDGTAGVLARLA